MSYIYQSSLNRKINETKEELKSILVLGTSPYNEILIDQLKARLAQLEEEEKSVAEAQFADTIRLRISGKNVPKGQISNRTLVAVLGGYQAVSESLASAILGIKASRGKINQFIKELTDYKLVEIFDGSFGVVLQKEDGKAAMDSKTIAESTVIEEMFSLLEYSNDGSFLIQRISTMGQRTINRYREWMNDILENDVTVDLGYKDRSAEYREVTITPDLTRAIIRTLDSIDETSQEEVAVVGTLTGLNLRSGSFELQTETGSILKGNSTFDILVTSKESLGKKIDAQLIKTTTNLKSNISQVSWYLRSVQSIF